MLIVLQDEVSKLSKASDGPYQLGVGRMPNCTNVADFIDNVTSIIFTSEEIEMYIW